MPRLRMSHVEFIRRVAKLGTRQPFYEALRLYEAASYVERLEAENADLRRALDLMIDFLEDHVAPDWDSERLIELLRAVMATHAPVTPDPPVAVGGEVLVLRNGIGMRSVADFNRLNRSAPPFVPDAEGDTPGPDWFTGNWEDRAYDMQERSGTLLPAEAEPPT